MKRIHSFDEVLDAQKVFRLVLRAMANPATAVDIGEAAARLYGAAPELLAVAMTLLDNEVGFSACGDDALAGRIISLTLAREESLENADFIFVSDTRHLKDAIQRAKCGTLSDPHKSATLVVGIDDGKGATLRLAGPGIRGAAEIRTSKAVEEALGIRDAQGYEYPQGIDFIFVTGNGALFAVPRLTSREAG